MSIQETYDSGLRAELARLQAELQKRADLGATLADSLLVALRERDELRAELDWANQNNDALYANTKAQIDALRAALRERDELLREVLGLGGIGHELAVSIRAALAGTEG